MLITKAQLTELVSKTRLKEQAVLIAEDYFVRGYSQTDIAEKFCLSRQRISIIVKQVETLINGAPKDPVILSNDQSVFLANELTRLGFETPVEHCVGEMDTVAENIGMRIVKSLIFRDSE